MSRVLHVVAFLPTLAALSTEPVYADDFGCKVLLCILNPEGWASVSECVPPVERAFSLVARGHPWPQCPEAGSSGRIGYEKYMPCPDGTVAATATNEWNGSSNSAHSEIVYKADKDGAFCARPLGTSTSYGSQWGSNSGARLSPTAIPREVRTEPNYLDLTTTDGKQRFWFNLSKYQ
ncbi:hypothetical protein QA648_35045 (plasmid) [Rhizobium sp. CB3171]|uniref:hypothetical protein n=1 Tax=Rhizobium sp. CB3171 TaxID=3039157 RepID=UPI0024B164E1|nr:hypothetical protein [Rhizobium sp. CB3171]WFU07125.1 hypothetical protein QA648_35045 [Rhizobium sp. CB3171]